MTQALPAVLNWLGTLKKLKIIKKLGLEVLAFYVIS